MSDCEFCHEGLCAIEESPCSCRGPGGVCLATPDDLIEACCPDPACCYKEWNGERCDCGEECSGCPVGKIMQSIPDTNKHPGSQEDLKNALISAVTDAFKGAGIRMHTINEQMDELCDPKRHVR